MAYMTDEQLKSMGFRNIGENVKISEKASIYNPANISIGDNARIDDFCIISAGDGGIDIGKYVHVACYCSIIGKGKVVLEDYVGISGRTSIYSSNDDYSGTCFTVPTLPDEYRNIHNGDVILKKFAIVGTGTVILPDVRLGIAASVGAMSLVRSDCEDFGIYVGCPVRKIGSRKQDILELEQKFLKSLEA